MDDDDPSPPPRRSCRICQQSESPLVRPCACSGTMADVHQTCLERWVARGVGIGRPSRHECEICRMKYAESGRLLRPLREWLPPKIERPEVFTAITLFATTRTAIGQLFIMLERDQFARPLQSGWTTGDFVHFLLFLLALFCVFLMYRHVLAQALGFLDRQRRVIYVDEAISAKRAGTTSSVSDELAAPIG